MSQPSRRRTIAKWITVVASMVIALGAAPRVMNATLITYYWTSGQPNGVIAYTATSRPVTIEMDTDVYGYGSFNNIDYDVTSLTINEHVICSGAPYSAATQHSAYDPANGEYEWQESETSSVCGS